MTKKLVRKFVRDEEGQGLIEYALLATLLVIVVIVAARALGRTVDSKFKKIDQEIKKG